MVLIRSNKCNSNLLSNTIYQKQEKKMKIKILLLMLILLIPQVLGLSVEPYYGGNTFSQNTQYYTVNFDNEGEASVFARLNFHNIESTPLNTIKLEIPGNNIRIINVVQEYYTYTDVCVKYDYIHNNF